MIIHSTPTSEVRGSNPAPYVEKMIDALRWSSVYSTKPCSVESDINHKQTKMNERTNERRSKQTQSLFYKDKSVLHCRPL